MDILDDQQQPAIGCLCAQQLEDRLEEPQPAHRVVRRGLPRRGGAELRQHRGQIAGSRSQVLHELRRADHCDVVAEGLDEGQVWQGEFGLAAAAPEDDCPESLSAILQLPCQPRLAEACLTGQQGKSAVTS